jgi:outer membrane protein OmpA-like peptidoglycan-associated protein
MKVLLTVLSILLLYAPSAFAAALAWDIPKGERLEITRTAEVTFLVNSTEKKTYDERNIIDLTCYDVRDGVSSVKGLFTVYERESGEEVFRTREQYPSDFGIDRLGKFKVPKNYYMPNLRHLPTFPARDIQAGEKWSADAELVLDNFSVPFRLTFPVEYRLVETARKDGVDTAVIEFRFIINMDMTGRKTPADFPVKIAARNDGTILWDIKDNRPVSMKEKYRIMFLFATGEKEAAASEFQMRIQTSMRMYKPVTEEDREKAKRELKKDIPDGVDVDTDRRGLVVRLDDVLFDFDSSNLREDSREKLDKISAMLKKKYPDREIIVEGHTDNTGGPEYNRGLSRDRAGTVAKYLKPRTGSDKLSYRGFGADRPIAGNDSKEGRQKNRRVEIIIKLQ